MSRYRKISLSMYSDAGFRALSKPEPNGQSLWVWLLTGPMTTVIPGIIVSGPAGMSERIGWPVEGFAKAFQEVLNQGMAEADFENHLVWLPKAIEHNRPQSPNVVKSWTDTWSELPECEFKNSIKIQIENYLKTLGNSYLEAFKEVCGNPSSKALSKPSRKPSLNQEQEQEQEQEEEGPPNLAALSDEEKSEHDPRQPYSNSVGIQRFLDDCKQQGVQQIPEDDAIFEYAQQTGIAEEHLRLCWLEFVERSQANRKKYKDWRGAFRNCVRGRWYKLWWINESGESALTADGRQAANKHREVLRRAS